MRDGRGWMIPIAAVAMACGGAKAPAESERTARAGDDGIAERREVARSVGDDPDGDGLADEIDQCPSDAEDRDDFEDLDGCPDPDNDRDGILDVNDRCPDEPENHDGFADGDGCPDRRFR